MSAPVKQVITDHDAWDRPRPVANPSPYTEGDDWRTGFEFGGGVG